ncbi:MAG: hypothetical protein ACI4WS_06200 [Oscillospiraceae bacterium]
MDLCQRFVDILDGRRAKITLDTGEVFVGKGFQPCIATYKNGEEGDGICFKCDSGQSFILADDEIIDVQLL